MYYVTMTDRFMSDWGLSAGRTNKLVIECPTYTQAEQIAQDMGALYLPLPMANGTRMAQAVNAALQDSSLPARALDKANPGGLRANSSATSSVWRNPGA